MLITFLFIKTYKIAKKVSYNDIFVSQYETFVFLTDLHNFDILYSYFQKGWERVMNKITPTQVLQITNILRLLGLNTSYFGTKIINKTIQYIIKYDIEFITLDKIYSNLCKEYNFNISTIRNNVNNALSNRNKILSINNFENVFGYEYYERNFEPKIFIEEVSNLIKK